MNRNVFHLTNTEPDWLTCWTCFISPHCKHNSRNVSSSATTSSNHFPDETLLFTVSFPCWASIVLLLGPAGSLTRRIQTTVLSWRVWMVWLETIKSKHTGSSWSGLKMEKSSDPMLVSPLWPFLWVEFLQFLMLFVVLVYRYWMLYSKSKRANHPEFYKMVKNRKHCHKPIKKFCICCKCWQKSKNMLHRFLCVKPHDFCCNITRCYIT